jgi:V/A-type H+-transporting ATPase subunit F
MKRIAFITLDEARPGFALAGVTHHAARPEEAEALLRKVMADPDTGLAVIEERLSAAIDEERFQQMEKRWSGVLLVLPTPAATREKAEEDYVEQLIRRAIGYHLRL